MKTVLAYYDCDAGMLPCTALRELDNGNIALRVNVTRGGYKRGEIIEGSPLWTIPRAHYHKSRRGPFYYYTTPYTWQELFA